MLTRSGCKSAEANNRFPPHAGRLSATGSSSRTVIECLKTPVRIGRSSRRTLNNEDVLRRSRFAVTIASDCKARPTRLDQAQRPSRIAYIQSAGCNHGVGNLRRHLSVCYSRFAPNADERSSAMAVQGDAGEAVPNALHLRAIDPFEWCTLSRLPP